MCKFRSAEACYNFDTGGVELKFLPNDDSHTAIRKANNVAEDDGSPMQSRHTPLEYVPHGALDDFGTYELVFDAGRPDWWTDEHTSQATRAFRANITAILAAGALIWEGNLNLGNLTSLPAGVTLEAGGDLNSLTSLPEGVTIKAKKIYLKD